MKAAAIALLLAFAAPALGSRNLLTPASAITDADLLNFALNLEYLEAQFYSWAALGHGLDASLLGANPGPVSGGRKADLSGDVADLALQLAKDEAAHVSFLREALGPAAINQPALNISSAFAYAANAALDDKLQPDFNPYDNDLFFLLGAYMLEDLGVTAYKGVLPSLANRQVLEDAAGIMAVEAYHGGSIRSALCPLRGVPTAYGLTPAAITQNISSLFNSLSGFPPAASAIVTSIGSQEACNLAPADSNALAFSRTPGQVIQIVTGGTNGKGLFFPAGLNGVVSAVPATATSG